MTVIHVTCLSAFCFGSDGPFPGMQLLLYARASDVHENNLQVHAPSVQLHEDKLEFNSSKRWMEYGAHVSFENFDHNRLASVMTDVEDSDSVTRHALTSERTVIQR